MVILLGQCPNCSSGRTCFRCLASRSRRHGKRPYRAAGRLSRTDLARFKQDGCCLSPDPARGTSCGDVCGKARPRGSKSGFCPTRVPTLGDSCVVLLEGTRHNTGPPPRIRQGIQGPSSSKPGRHRPFPKAKAPASKEATAAATAAAAVKATHVCPEWGSCRHNLCFRPPPGLLPEPCLSSVTSCDHPSLPLFMVSQTPRNTLGRVPLDLNPRRGSPRVVPPSEGPCSLATGCSSKRLDGHRKAPSQRPLVANADQLHAAAAWTLFQDP